MKLKEATPSSVIDFLGYKDISTLFGYNIYCLPLDPDIIFSIRYRTMNILPMVENISTTLYSIFP